MNSQRKTWLVVTLLVLSQACAAKETQETRKTKETLITDTEINSIITPTIEAAIQLRTLISACQKLEGEVSSMARRALRIWANNNWEYVLAADQAFTEQQKNKTVEYQGKTISIDALQLLAKGENKVLEDLNFDRRSSSSRIKTCEEHLRPYFRSQRNLITTPESKSIYGELLARYPVDVEGNNPRVYQLPLLAGGMNPYHKPGRSQYAVEKKARERGCTNPQLSTFVNQWPLEVYGAFCDDWGKLITCEWGQCRTN